MSARLPSRRIEATFGFIDMAGFTALTEQHGDFDAADVATRFADIARAALGPDDRLIKTIGDAVFVMSSPAAVSIRSTSSMAEPGVRDNAAAGTVGVDA